MGGRESEGARDGWGEEGEGRRERDGGTEWGCGEAEQALRWQHTSRASRSGALMQRFLFPLTHRPSTALRGYCGEEGGGRGGCCIAVLAAQRSRCSRDTQTQTRYRHGHPHQRQHLPTERVRVSLALVGRRRTEPPLARPASRPRHASHPDQRIGIHFRISHECLNLHHSM